MTRRSATLKPHISRWWDIANDRRQRLILAKYRGTKRLTKDQKRELEMLQKIADLIIEFYSPPRLPLDGILKAAEIAVGMASLHGSTKE